MNKYKNPKVRLYKRMKVLYGGSVGSFMYKAFTRHHLYFHTAKEVLEAYIRQKPNKNTPEFMEAIPTILLYIEIKLKRYWQIYPKPAVT